MVAYEIVRFEHRQPYELEPHPAAELIPMDEDDAAAIGESLGELGMLVPLLVLEPDAAGELTPPVRYRIVDGVNRWRQATAANLENLPVLVVRGDPETIVAQTLTARRKSSTAQRILVYLESHKADVIRAYDLAGSRVANMRNSRNPNVFPKESRDSFGRNDGEYWSCAAIAKRLRASAKDVQKGVELVVSLERGMVPRDWGGHPARLIDESDAKDREWLDRVREYRQQALAGRPLPIRRWKAAVGGQTATSGKGKADTDWNAVWSRSVRSLRHAFEHWSEVKRMEESLPPAWTNEMAAWDEMAASIPEELFPALYRRVFNQSAPELKRLINALKDKLKTIEE